MINYNRLAHRLSIGMTLIVAAICFLAPTMTFAADGTLHLPTRSRVEVAPNSGRYAVVDKTLDWDARQTAVIVIDVWDVHSCKSATARLEAMVPRMNAVVANLRERGALVVHAPSDTMKFYEGTPARKLAQDAPAAPIPPGIVFKWQYLDLAVEGTLPIDDTDGGCDDEPRCKGGIVWKSENPGIEIKPGDAISDKGQEIFNLLEQRGIKNVVILGVHANMCILGRSFGIREMTHLGKNVVLVRDLTDTMYNPKMPPFVPHAMGTQLVIEHTEKHWCPTILASSILGGEERKPHVVIVAAEQEYHAKETLPAFAKTELESRGMDCKVLTGDDPKTLEGTQALDDADLLILFARRRELPADQFAHFQKYFDSGKPIVGLRTASHAFQTYLAFDKEVLGGNYQNHYGKEGGTAITVAPGAETNPIFRGVSLPFEGKGSLYKNSPLPEATNPLLMGKWTDKTEPIAWTSTHKGGRVFYTSLGHPDDFQTPAFRRLLVNGILWALDKPIPTE
jgi:type 1 glutamine amidotransferase/nicotinamidase-related amidase